jgi:uncharacterized protein
MNRVVHFEIHAENPERAAAFYHGVFGWAITKWDGPTDYWLVDTGEGNPGIHGGIVRREGGAPVPGAAVNAFPCTVDIESLDATIASVQKHGGKLVVPKMEIPGIGWLAYANDTEGNIFGMMQSTQRNS